MPFDGNTVATKSLGGSESAAFYLARELARRGHRVSCWTSTDKDVHVDGVNYCAVGPHSQEFPLGERFDHYASHTPLDVLIMQRQPHAFHKKWNAKVCIWQLHDLALYRSAAHVLNGLWQIDAVTTVSQWHADQVKKVWGLSDDILRVVPDEKTAREVVETDHSLVRFYIPPEATWPVVSGRRKFEWPEGKRPKTLGEQLTLTVRAIARANPSLQGVIDIVDHNETRNGEREISDEALSGVIETLSDPRYRLGLSDVEPDFLGRAYEYLLRKFAEGQGQSAGEFFTPKEVGWLIAHLVQVQQGEEVCDPCCGSGGLLIKCHLALRERDKDVARPPKLYGQELTGSSFAIARMNMVLHDMEGEIVRGNTMTNPKFLDGSSLKQCDAVVTNPMWNQDNFDEATYENDPFERFSERGGFAPNSSADWAWLQHVLASLKATGRAAVVLDTGAASRGSGSQGENKEKAIRRWFVEQDVVEGVILLPDNMFYNTTAAGIIILLNRGKAVDRRGKVALVNASGEFQKGRPKNFIPDEAIRKIADAFHSGKDVDRLVKVVSVEDIAKNDYNLSPSRYIETAAPAEHRDIQTLLDELTALNIEAARLEGELKGVFTGLGYGWA